MVEFKYLNPIAGLAMLIIGFFMVSIDYFFYGITPIIVGAVLVVYYRRYLVQLMGG
ncbi:MAG: hypothetical protein ACREBU_08135 [Nitrososphaera sp.]